MSKSSATVGKIWTSKVSFLDDFQSLNASELLEYLGINIRITNTIIHAHIWLEY